MRQADEIVVVGWSLAGEERADALLSNTQRMRSTFGPPVVPSQLLLEWVADWIEHGGQLLGKPTKFEARDGRF